MNLFERSKKIFSAPSERNNFFLTISVIFLLIGLPLSISLVLHQTNYKSEAAEPSTIEPENGVLSGDTTIIDNANASGGKYIILGGTVTAPTGRTLTVGKNGTGAYATIQAATDVAQAGDTILIGGGTYQEKVTVKASGTATKYITFQNKPGETVVLDGNKTIAPGTGTGLFDLNGKSYIKVLGLNITRSPSTAVWGVGVSNIIISQCVVSAISNGGVVIIDSSNITIDACDISTTNDKGTSAAHEAISLANVNTFVVKNSKVHHNGEEGIDAKNGARNGEIYNNQSYYNRGPNIYIDAGDNIKIHNNIVHHSTHFQKPGILLGVETYTSTRRNSEIDIYNNIIYKNAAAGLGFFTESTGTMTGIRIVNNTFYGNVGSDISAYNTPTLPGVNIIRNNIMATGNGAVTFQGAASFTIDHNFAGNPGFLSIETDDVHLASDSRAIDAGISTGAPSLDFDGKARPSGAQFDIGAYEN